VGNFADDLPTNTKTALEERIQDAPQYERRDSSVQDLFDVYNLDTRLDAEFPKGALPSALRT